MSAYLDRDWFDRLHDEAAEHLSLTGERWGQREMVAASLLADDGRATHHTVYPRRFPAARESAHSTNAAAAGGPRVHADVPPLTAPVPAMASGAGESSIHAQPGGAA